MFVYLYTLFIYIYILFIYIYIYIVLPISTTQPIC